MSERNPTTGRDEQTTIEAEPREVLDPEDYAQNQRIKDIHEARRHVRQALKDLPKVARESDHVTAHGRLADAVAAYGYEVLPILEQIDYDPNSEKLRESESFPWDSIEDFITRMGHPPEDYGHQYVVRQHSMVVYHALNQTIQAAGLGMQFDDGNDEWEIET